MTFPKTTNTVGFTSPGIVVANKVIIYGPNDSLLMYNGNPTANNLIASDSPSQFFDQYGNNVLAGTVFYNNNGYACQLVGNGISVSVNSAAPNQSGTWNNVSQFTWLESDHYWAISEGGLELNGEYWIYPSGDATGATDPANLNALLSPQLPIKIHVMPGQYYGDATVTGCEAQFIDGAGKECTFWNMTVTGIAAFNWTPANPTSYSQTGTGGVTNLTIFGPSATAHPTDGSIGLQMGSIVQLQSNVECWRCEYGLLLENQYFWSEQGHHYVITQGCTNPVICQKAASPGPSATGSFERTEIVYYANEGANQTDPLGQGLIQFLNGAIFADGTKLELKGNVGGEGQTPPVYGIYIDGTSFVRGCNVDIGIEYDPVSQAFDAPATIFIASGGAMDACYGVQIWTDFGAGSISGGFQFFGPITGDDTLTALTEVSGFAPTLTGLSGDFFAHTVGASGIADITGSITVAASTAIAHGAILTTNVPAQYTPPSNRYIVLVLNDTGVPAAIAFPCAVTSTGEIEYLGAAYTTSGASSLLGTAQYLINT